MGDPMFNPVFRSSTPAGAQGAKGQRSFGAVDNGNNGLFSMGSTGGADVVAFNSGLVAQSVAPKAKPKADDTKSIVGKISLMSGKEAANLLNGSLAAQLQNPPEEGFMLD